MEKYIWFIPLLPLLGFFINGLGRNTFSKSMIGTIGSGLVFVSFILSVLVFMNVPSGAGAQPMIFHAFDIINFKSIQIPFSFQIDALTSLFLLVITGIGFLIHVYSSAYMHDDEGFGKFFAYLNLFIFFMLILVMGSNFFMMFIGWEGVGLCSFLLIGFWFKNRDFVGAAKKAFIMNRIGDVGFLLAMFWIYREFGTLQYTEVFGLLSTTHISTFAIGGITLLLFLAATGKSAQVPLFTWLPDAMAGPTPVSALIHAATMVTAGIFLITRCNELFELAPYTKEIIAWIGIITSLTTATIAMRQNDIKKVLAYSTVSQLGLMFAALGMGAYVAAVFHVMTHAFFKALLFLGAGSVIHGMHHEQDMTKMGGLKKYMPTTHITMLIGCIAIAGIPPLSGFFSKDEMLLSMFLGNKAIYAIGFIVSVLTSFYMFRLYFMTFSGKLRDESVHPHESPKAMTIPLIILAVLSIVGGWVGIPELFMKNAHRLNEFLSGVVIPHGEPHHISHATEWMLIGALLSCVAVAILLANKWYNGKVDKEATGLAKVLENKWYIDEIYQAAIVSPLIGLGNFFKKYVEKSGIVRLVDGTGDLSYVISKNIKTVQTGNIGMYILLMVIGIVAGLGIFFFGII
ncbi:NADH-quinone oxidoreductase subunit L [Moheibacter lacus]|uniref:NADH-quinone oxidoreductase subunit L n=1 Tax=Moheibacter lacus TaxID=2745851 RepID=A0A838ZRJ9_9FLAO|nr:NADH-quinone oxidoreductase subunit L [Moheibacter lacus]MBA5629262.1 NADH-quinone oxidoreductase subunit L [Moheibacter lacus]